MCVCVCVCVCVCDEKFDLNEVDHSRFVKPASDEELKSLAENQENVNTKNNTKWAINVFNKWREQCMEDIPQLHEMNADVMNYWLQRFIVEARRKDGAELYALRILGGGGRTPRTPPLNPPLNSFNFSSPYSI